MILKKLVLPTVVSLLMVFAAGCKKDSLTNAALATPASPSALSASKTLSGKSQQQLEAVNLGLSGEFTILSKSGITDVYKSSVTGDIGTSPITGAAIGLTCTEVVGNIYSVDAAGPLPCRLTNATRLTLAVCISPTAKVNLVALVSLQGSGPAASTE